MDGKGETIVVQAEKIFIFNQEGFHVPMKEDAEIQID